MGVPDEMLRSIGLIVVLSAQLELKRVEVLEAADQGASSQFTCQAAAGDCRGVGHSSDAAPRCDLRRRRPSFGHDLPDRARTRGLREPRQANATTFAPSSRGLSTRSTVRFNRYPQRPSEETVEQLEAIALPKGIMIVFYDDMEWRADAP